MLPSRPFDASGAPTMAQKCSKCPVFRTSDVNIGHHTAKCGGRPFFRHRCNRPEATPRSGKRPGRLLQVTHLSVNQLCYEPPPFIQRYSLLLSSSNGYLPQAPLALRTISNDLNGRTVRTYFTGTLRFSDAFATQLPFWEKEDQDCPFSGDIRF
jgi:hypothetical protein